MSIPTGVRRCSLTRALACLLVWAVAAVGALLIASETRAGPVLMGLSENHGIHAGDLLALAGGALVALLATVVIMWPCVRARYHSP